jgi:hypothetical protein
MVRSCEHGNEASGPTEGKDFSTGWVMIMSMGWRYVSELRPLVVPQVRYEHWEQWRNDIDTGDILT